MINIYDTANQLAQELPQTPEFVAAKQALAAVKADNNAFELFTQMSNLQEELTKAQEEGSKPSEEQIKLYQELATKAQANNKLMDLMLAQQTLLNLVTDVQKSFMKPLDDLFGEQ